MTRMQSDISAKLSFTPELRDVLESARELVTLYRTDALTVEHLLLALLRSPQSRAFQLVRKLGVDVSELEQTVSSHLASKALVEDHPRLRKVGALPYTTTAARVLPSAMVAVQERGAPEVDTVDLLLGISALAARGQRPWYALRWPPRATRWLIARGLSVDRVAQAR